MDEDLYYTRQDWHDYWPDHSLPFLALGMDHRYHTSPYRTTSLGHNTTHLDSSHRCGNQVLYSTRISFTLLSDILKRFAISCIGHL